MKLTYWYAECRDDSDVYSIRTRTKREAVETKASKERHHGGRFGPVVKVVVDYRDGFDLMQLAAGEGGLCEEAIATLEAEDDE